MVLDLMIEAAIRGHDPARYRHERGRRPRRRTQLLPARRAPDSHAWITDSEVLDGATQTTTHEIVESLSDPEGTAILGTPGTCDGKQWCEIADICSGGVKLHG